MTTYYVGGVRSTKTTKSLDKALDMALALLMEGKSVKSYSYLGESHRGVPIFTDDKNKVLRTEIWVERNRRKGIFVWNKYSYATDFSEENDYLYPGFREAWSSGRFE